MPYPFPEYLRHNNAWGNARSLTRGRPMPEQGDVWIDIGHATSVGAVNVRIMHMLSELGCTQDERRYYGPRFFFVSRFMALNMERLTKEWLVTIEDGKKAVVTKACQQAILEAFEPEPLPEIDDVDIEKIVARGRELLE